MSTIIQIKRSANVAAPTTTDLLQGELAYSYDQSNSGASAKLYIEAVDSIGSPVIHTIGGKYYTDAVDGAASSNTANKLIKRDSLGSFAANVITANKIIAPIEGTATSATIANTANTLTTARTIELTGDVTGSVLFDGSQNVQINTTTANNAVALGTDTTGDYLSNVTAGTGLVVSGTPGEGWNPTVSLISSGVTALTYGGSSKIPVITVDTYGRVTSAANVSVAGVSSFTASGNTFTISTADGGNYSASIQLNSVRLGNETTGAYVANLIAGTGVSLSGLGDEGATPAIALSSSGVTAGSYGGASTIPTYTVDAYGRLTSATNVSIALPSSALTTDVALGTQTSGAYVANLIAGTGITISGLGNEGAIPTITNSGVTGLSGTTNEIEVSTSTGSVQIGLPNDVTIGNNLTVTGDLVVNGTAITINTSTVTVEDPLVKFGSTNPADSLDIGFFGQYTATGAKYAGLFRDASDSGKFKLFNALTVDPVSNVISTADYTVASLVANLTGGVVSGLTSAIGVADGGSGRTSVTTNALLYGQGTNSLAEVTGTTGQILQLNGSGVPIFGGIDGGTY